MRPRHGASSSSSRSCRAGSGRIVDPARHLLIEPGGDAAPARVSANGIVQVMIGTASWIGLVRILSGFGSAALAGYTIGMRIDRLRDPPVMGNVERGRDDGGTEPRREEAGPRRARRLEGGALQHDVSRVRRRSRSSRSPGRSSRLFTSDPRSCAYGADCLRIVSYGFLFYAFGMVLTQAFNGAGDTWTPTWINLVCFWLWEIPLAWVLAHRAGIGPRGAFCGHHGGLLDARRRQRHALPPGPVEGEEDLSMRFSIRALRVGFRVLGIAAPPVATRLAERLFGTPRKHRTSEREREVLARGKSGRVSAGGDSVATWTWGQGPAVLLVHGWGSRGARLHSFVEPLVAAGRTVVAFDAPGHGDSSGAVSSLPQFALAILAVARDAGGIEAAVAHSMGAPATAFAMTRGLALDRAVFLAPTANPGAYVRRFAEILAVPPRVIEAMKRRFEKRFDLRWEELDLRRAAAAFTARLLVFHDSNDTEVPWSDGASIARAWPGAELVTTEGLGHIRIVHDPDVVARATAFVAASPRDGQSHQLARGL